MVGEIEVNDLAGVMNVSISISMAACGTHCMRYIQLWLDNQSTFAGLSSTASRFASLLSGLSNAVLGQTRSQARLNAIASYDQSNELFKVNALMFKRAASLVGVLD